METEFNWNKTKQLTPLQIVLAFLLPSAFAFTGFRFVLPALVNSGQPKTLMWGVVASIMLFVLVILGVVLVQKDSKTLGISLAQRMCLKKISGKLWLISLGVMVLGIIVSMTVSPLVQYFARIPGLHIPDFMPFWLDPSINPMNTDIEILSPGYPLKGNTVLVSIMAITLLLNILAEEIYFRAWLLPKMQSLGKWSWVINATLFALYHTYQLWLFPVLLVVSLATTFVIQLSKSIWPAFTVHIISNFLLSIVGILVLVYG